MPRYSSSLALLAAVSLLGACGSSADTAEDATDFAPSNAGVEDAAAIEEASADGTASEAPAIENGTCETWTENGPEYVRFDFVATAPGINDYSIRIAEPDGSNESAFLRWGIEQGDVVSFTQKIVGAPADCTMMELEPISTTIDHFSDVTSCTMVAPIPPSTNAAFEVEFTNSGAEAADYQTVVHVRDTDGVIVSEATVTLLEELAAGETATATGVSTIVDPEGDFTCDAAWIRRR